MFDEVLLSFISDHFAFYRKINDNKSLKKDLWTTYSQWFIRA
jgi:hypothetical protein